MLRNEEEFNNFMHRVNDVTKIIKNLSSTDKSLNQIGVLEADQYLQQQQHDVEIIDDDTSNPIKYRVKSNKTIINRKGGQEDEDQTNEQYMSQEAFKRQVEQDAKRRYEDKKIRKEKSDTFKMRANKAFHRNEYEKALSLYNQAIELIKDSGVLYTNRALTYLHLQFYEKAIQDCETALKLNESSLKSWLYMANSWYRINNFDKSSECIEEATKRNPDSKDQIMKYVNEFRNKN